MTLRELVLKDLLAKLRPHYDHILIDCPPSLGLLTVNALAAADRVIIPMQPEFLATRGLTLLLRTLAKVQTRLNRNLKIAGILPEASAGKVVLGIGVNVGQEAGELPAETPKPPTSLRVETGRDWPRAPLLSAILAALERRYDAWQELHATR